MLAVGLVPTLLWRRTRPLLMLAIAFGAGAVASLLTGGQPPEPDTMVYLLLLPYALFAGVLLMLLIYFVGAEEGATSLIGGHAVHEWVHDARHLLGFPCH